VTAPTPGLTVRLGYPVTTQLSVLGWPAATFAGVAVNPVMAGGLPTSTVTQAAVDPKSLLAVRTYDVVAAGVTMTDVPSTGDPATVPTSEIEPMVRLAAPVTDQLSVLGWPGSTLAGDAAKRAMMGRSPVDARAGPICDTPANRRKPTVTVRIVVPSSYRPVPRICYRRFTVPFWGSLGSQSPNPGTLRHSIRRRR
jgi:hypothetical protein